MSEKTPRAGAPASATWCDRAAACHRRSWVAAVKRAKLPGKVTPHTLRHTRATWLMRSGVTIWDAAQMLGMSALVVDRVYGHHSTDYQQ